MQSGSYFFISVFLLQHIFLNYTVIYSNTYIRSFKKKKIWARCSSLVAKVLTLHVQDPIWAPVCVPDTPLPISSLLVAWKISRG